MYYVLYKGMVVLVFSFSVFVEVSSLRQIPINHVDMAIKY